MTTEGEEMGSYEQNDETLSYLSTRLIKCENLATLALSVSILSLFISLYCIYRVF